MVTNFVEKAILIVQRNLNNMNIENMENQKLRDRAKTQSYEEEMNYGILGTEKKRLCSLDYDD